MRTHEILKYKFQMGQQRLKDLERPGRDHFAELKVGNRRLERSNECLMMLIVMNDEELDELGGEDPEGWIQLYA